jgi:hypothetical protein
MENNIKVVRFKDGYDVICFLEEKEEYTYEILEPMAFEVRNTNLVMQQWLPIAMIKENKATIKGEDILCVMDPSDDFKEYFCTTVEKVNKALESKNKKSSTKDDDMKDMVDILSAMDEMDNIKNIKLH